MSTTVTDGWRVRAYPQIAAVGARTLAGAILSRVESGAVYAEPPARRRSWARGAVYDGAGELVPASQRLGGMNSDLVYSANPPALTHREQADAQLRRLEGRWLYAGTWMHGFGHFIVETLPTMWPLLGDPAGFDGVVAHRFTSDRAAPWQQDLARLLTDRDVEVIDDDPATAAELVVPDRPYRYQVAISPVAARVWDHVAERAGGTGRGGRVYLSRTRFEADQIAQGRRTGRQYTNSEAVDQVFADHGFRIAYPETMGVLDQVRLARDATLLAGKAGSAPHLAAFSRPGARVIELGDARTKDQMIATQQAISAAKDQPTAFIPYVADDRGAVDLDHLQAALARLL